MRSLLPPFIWSRLVDRLQAASATEVYAIGTRLVVAAVSFASGIAAVALFQPARIGVFLAFTGLAAFSTLTDLGMSYSLLLATASRKADDARRLATAALAAGLPTVAMTGVVLFASGSFFLQGEGERVFWPWASYCAASSVQQFMMLVVTYAEGTGDRHAAWRANFLLEVAAGVVTFLLIISGLELWSFPVASLVRITLVAVLFAPRLKALRLGGQTMAHGLGLWRTELWPMQWKTFVNNALGLATTRLLTPILLKTEGASSAGRVGLLLALAAVITAATAAWPLSQTALYAALYEEGNRNGLKALLKRTLVRSTALSLAVVFAASLAGQSLPHWSGRLASRLPDPLIIWLILAGCPLAHLTSFCAIMVRSQRRDPVVIPNMILAIPMLALLAYGSRFGPLTFALTYIGAVAVFTCLYGGYALAFWRQLRVPPAAPAFA